MILDTMTPKEICSYLVPVRERIATYAENIGKRACKNATKNVWINLGVKHITYENDVYYFSTMAKRYKKNGCIGVDIVCMPYVMITRNNGSRYVLQFELDFPRVLRTYEIHLFQRYSERFLKQTKFDLWNTIHKYFMDNNFPGLIVMGEGTFGTIINKGIALGNEIPDLQAPITVFKYRTFITQQMLFEDQGAWDRDGCYSEMIRKNYNLFDEGGPQYNNICDYKLNLSIDSLRK